jgi:hypothetical protein
MWIKLSKGSIILILSIFLTACDGEGKTSSGTKNCAAGFCVQGDGTTCFGDICYQGMPGIGGGYSNWVSGSSSGTTAYYPIRKGVNYTVIGSAAFGSDGSVWQTIGNAVFGPNGTSCVRIGTTMFC